MSKLVKGLLSPIGALLFGRKKGRPIEPLPLVQATRDDAAAAAGLDDELRRRKGGAADILTGFRGAEPLSGQVGRTLIGN
jgi:hypothetical protein